MEGDHRWEAAQKTSCRVRASFQAGFNFRVQDAPQNIFHFSTYISEGQMYPLKAIYDFNIGTQDRVAQAKHPHFFSETVISDKVCAKQSANWSVAFYFEDELKKMLCNTFTTLIGDKINHYHPQTWLLKTCIHLVQPSPVNLLFFPSNLKISTSFWKGGC